jgi:integrase
MAKHRTSGDGEKTSKGFPKTDVRYWRGKLFKRTTDEWQVQVGYAGRQERFPLKTANADEAAGKAKDIYLSLHAVGWDETLAKFKPWIVEAKPKAESITVGQYLQAYQAVATIKPTAFTSYERKFHKLVADIMDVAATKKEKHDYYNGASEQYRRKIDAAPLSAITPERVAQWRVEYIKQAGKNPAQQNAARVSAASIIRNSKSLFSKKYLPLIKLPLPSPLPFDGITLGKLPRNRYHSTINPVLLVNLAAQDLRDGVKQERPARRNLPVPMDPQEVYKVFLLAIGAGLRRGEIDKLTWGQFDWTAGTIRMEVNEYGGLKTESSAEVIDIGPQLASYFKDQFAKSKSDYVIGSAPVEGEPEHWESYRCEKHFRDLIAWLKSKGVTSRNPIHTLRKEFGSLINKQFGIFAASAALRHSKISITRDIYVDKKERIALDFAQLQEVRNG